MDQLFITILNQKSSILKKSQLYLCDSGAQYIGGTTDITRTIYLRKKSCSAKNKRYIYVGSSWAFKSKYP